MTMTTATTTIRQREITGFKHLSNFKDVNDFNNQFEQAMIYVKEEFTKAERVALKYLTRWAVKVVGVCNARIAKLVASTHKEGMGISESTFKRMLKKAVELGLIIVHNTERKNGSQSSNVYIFNRYESVIQPTKEVGIVSKSTTIEAPEKEILNPLETSNLSNTHKPKQDIKTRSEQPSISDLKLDASYTDKRIPKAFILSVSPLYDDALKIERFWKQAQLAGKNQAVTCEDRLLQASREAMQALLRKMKVSQVDDEHGFFYGTMRKILGTKMKNKFKSMFWDF